MIECIVSVDYEIFGDGNGALRDLVVEPTERLKTIFDAHNAKLVIFFEALEFQQIERHASDPDIGRMRDQIRRLYEDGHEIGLHLHPQWANARRSGDKWELDYAEYNLCTLGAPRIAIIVDQAIEYMRGVTGDPNYTPCSFRAGNWLFQPTADIAKVLASRGVKIDSSVFKGGRYTQLGLDYRPSLKNPPCWPFSTEVNSPDPSGQLLEVPIHTELVWPWRFIAAKRMELKRGARGRAGRHARRWRDFLRLRYPLKFDLNRMRLNEMCQTVGNAISQPSAMPAGLKPVVAIVHTKGRFDYNAIGDFLKWLQARGIAVGTFRSFVDRWSSTLPVCELARSITVPSPASHELATNGAVMRS